MSLAISNEINFCFQKLRVCDSGKHINFLIPSIMKRIFSLQLPYRAREFDTSIKLSPILSRTITLS